MNKSFVFLDTETTGLDFNSDKIIEIFLLKTDADFNSINELYLLINPEREISQEAFKVHGISYDNLKDKPVFIEVVKDIIDFIGNDTLIAHNAFFDISMLNAEFNRANHPELKNEVICSLELARKKLPNSKHSLNALASKFSLENKRIDKHDAKSDVILLVSIYKKLIDYRIDLLSSLNKDFKQMVRPIYPARVKPLIPRLTHEELRRHTEFIRKIKKGEP